MASERKRLRAQVRRHRQSLTREDFRQLSAQLARRAFASLTIARASRIAAFMSRDGEVDVLPLMMRLIAIGKRIYVPQIDGPRLHFLPMYEGVPLSVHAYGILEPDLPPQHRCKASSLDIVLTPLVAFDNEGNRLGMGGGYYDRTFGYLLRRQRRRKPIMLGVAFEFQRLAGIKAEPWDVALDGVVTERGVQIFRPKRFKEPSTT